MLLGSPDRIKMPRQKHAFPHMEATKAQYGMQVLHTAGSIGCGYHHQESFDLTRVNGGKNVMFRNGLALSVRNTRALENNSVNFAEESTFSTSAIKYLHRRASILTMAGPRRKYLAASKRRVDEEGEDEEGPMVAGIDNDSMSEASAISDADDDADAEGSEISDVEVHQAAEQPTKAAVNGRSKPQPDARYPVKAAAPKSSFAVMTNDTAAMMNGLQLGEDMDDAEEIQFDDLAREGHAPAVASEPGPAPSLTPVTSPASNLTDKRRQEHEEYKKRRDADPSFVPNRGGFFMHDSRSVAQGRNGFRPFGNVRGKGRGRGTFAGPQPMASQASQASGLTGAPWAHDLHETVTQWESDSIATKNAHSTQHVPVVPSTSSVQGPPPPNRSFSRTTRIGKVQIRVSLSGMAEPIVISGIPVNQHTRLPHHRPPLRRDKPVRVSIPDMQVRYIFPSTDRSFIFIPRALRPNQQGFGRTRARGSFNIGYGPLSSRRTSVYAGSGYSPSVALSRRSSLAREMATEGVISPSVSTLPRPHNMAAELGKPVVRLPPAAQQAPGIVAQGIENIRGIPIVNLPAYPLPENPTYRENRPAPLPMHQPKPQKTVSVTDIESPATFAFNPPQQHDQQPFHQQVPTQVMNQVYQQEPSLYPHSRHPSHPSQASGGSPHPQLSERAAHAQPFQPYAYQQPPPFLPQPYPPTLFYYPTSDQLHAAGPSVMAPAFVPGQPYPFSVPVAPTPLATEATAQPGTVAHESNGMVYYYDSSQLNGGVEGSTSYAGPDYAMAPAGGVVGIGGMMTPPIQFYPQPSPAVYYPPQ
ncbi:MAG: hypothetical protein L6R42_003526 [Xanthoria sp. 1 TBL-2021]|nr:MAG: hypothetical protein L6R42_003526 [Xanthoria sp. 1 TBL-2021]